MRSSGASRLRLDVSRRRRVRVLRSRMPCALRAHGGSCAACCTRLLLRCRCVERGGTPGACGGGEMS